MPFKKKSILGFISFISINSLFLSTANRVAAKTPNNKNKYSSFSAIRSTQNQNTSTKSELEFDFVRFSNLNIIQTVAVDSQESTSPLESGTPSLRRQPSGGERFEPKRIPLRIPLPKEPYRASPSITIVNPSAYGASWRSAGIGFGFQERVRFDDQSDGVIGLGFGLGNPQKNVGAQVGISLVDVSAPFRDGAVNLKLHRRLPKDFAVALGVQGLATFGNTDGGSSVYGVVTKRFKLRQDRTKPFSEIYTSLGVGGGQFRSESDINNGNETLGVFTSFAVKIIEPVGLVAEWSGQDLTIGTPIVLFRKLPIVIVPAVTDITGSAGDGARFILGAGYTFSF
ncbi:hypothetical protein [Pleurocapsa sp. PCC 7319]|uniref:hypothetical protein n=1 Tax=Pleurocapsa sp. PCC 7319 TaxID=118161 RepID=UPI0003495110|nr:hypothetical protein [Pleurocapsa sp. PCC 7319]